MSMMTTIKKFLLVSYAIVLALPSTAWLQNDILDVAFQPSKNLDQVINIGNNKNAVGNEIFRGSTNIEASIGLFAHCYKIDHIGEDNCEGETRKADSGKCYVVPETSEKDENRCNNTGGERRKLKYAAVIAQAPLLVRITQTLLRLTIALSIPVLIWIGIKVIKAGLAGGDIKESLKEVSGVLIGLMLALSAVGIIYLIQSIATQSLIVGSNESPSIVDTTKKDQACIGLPINAERNTASAIDQNLNTADNTYKPTTQGKYSITPSKNTCIFKCKNNYFYDNIGNTCIDTTQTKKNQKCTGLPINAEWNTTSTITQNWNAIENNYLPNTLGKYNETPSTTTCVFWCRPGYYYDGNVCTIRRKANQQCTGLPTNAEWNTTSTITQIWNAANKIYLPTTIGKYNDNSSTNACVFKCKAGYIYDENTCIMKLRNNQACTGLPINAEWNTATGITQIWNSADHSYIPTTIGKYSITASTNTCVFKCKTGHNYLDRTCQ